MPLTQPCLAFDHRDVSTACTDCPRSCAQRGPKSFCGIDQPGRVAWRGVTLLEEHELAPTYEVYFTGCSLRCRFCTVPDAIERPTEGTWMAPEALAKDLASDRHPPFRSVSLVGGDPVVNLPYVRQLVPALRAHVPHAELVLNTNLYLNQEHAAELAESFDWIVGDVHFWQPDCAAAIAGCRDYPAVATAAAEALLDKGARLILRVLVLPEHLDCCAAPTVAWAAKLQGDCRVHLMTHYAPAGRARGHAQLGRALTPEEQQRAHSFLPPTTRVPRSEPLTPLPARPTAQDPPAPIEVGPDGRILFPFVTGTLLPLAAALDPSLNDRLQTLEPDAR